MTTNGNGQQHTIYPMIRECDPHSLIFIQSRAQMDFYIVDEYAELMQAGTTFDPCEAVEASDGTLFVWDGFHRGEAAKKINKPLTIRIEQGEKELAEWKAQGANVKHGLRRSQEDIRRSVLAALQHPRGATMSDRQIAEHCGTTHPTVGKYRKELEASGKIYQMPTRDVQRGDQTYQIEIAGAEAYYTIQELERVIRGRLTDTRKERLNYLQNIIQNTIAGQAYLRDIESELKGEKKWRKADLIATAKKLRAELEQLHCATCDFVGKDAQMFEQNGQWYCAKCFHAVQQPEQPQPPTGDAPELDNLILQRIPTEPKAQIETLRKMMFDIDDTLQGLVKQITGFPANIIRDRCHLLWERLSEHTPAKPFSFVCDVCGKTISAGGISSPDGKHICLPCAHKRQPTSFTEERANAEGREVITSYAEKMKAAATQASEANTGASEPNYIEKMLNVRIQNFSDDGLHLLIKLAKHELTRRHKPAQEGDQGKKYEYEITPGDGRVIMVCGGDNNYYVAYRKPNGSFRRLTRKELPVRGTRAEAQADLDAFAKQHNLQAAREDAPPAPEPATATTEPQAQESKPLAAATTKEEETVLGWYSQGWSVNKIADWCHISKSSVRQILQHAQTDAQKAIVEPQPPEPVQTPTTDAEAITDMIRLMDEQGMTFRGLEVFLNEQKIVRFETGKPWSKSVIEREIKKARKEGKII